MTKKTTRKNTTRKKTEQEAAFAAGRPRVGTSDRGCAMIRNDRLRKSASVREQLQASDLLDKARLIDVETVRRFLKLNARARALINDIVCSIIEAPKVKAPKKRAGAK